MELWQSRTAQLIGVSNVDKLKRSRVAIFGIGGVGGFVVEALTRSGIGHMDLIDHDTVSESNLNRQLVATLDTIGRKKVDVMKERILSINPNAEVATYDCFYLPENKDEFDFSQYDYVVDAVDTVTAKLTIIEEAKKAGIPVISSMGTGNKLNPSLFEVADISKTCVCPLAKVMRKELKNRGITQVKVVYSKEEPKAPTEQEADKTWPRKVVPASIAFVPSVAGLILAGEVIKDICDL